MDRENLIPGLNFDEAIQCIARVPRSAYGVLRCVNRSWRNLLSSSFIFSFRKNHGLCEDWLYIMLRSTAGRYEWKAFQVSQRIWQSLPPMPSITLGAACAVLDSKLFVIGGSQGGIPKRQVWIYDPCFNRWTVALPMRVPREFAAAGAIGGKIYVVGGCLPGSWAGSIAWAETYDPLVGKWTIIASPPDRRERWMHGSAVLDDKLFAVGDLGGLVMDPCSNKWGSISASLDRGWRGKVAVVKGMLFSWNYSDKIMAYHLGKDDWRALELVENPLPKLQWGFVMASVSRRLFVLGECSSKRDVSVLSMSAVDVEEGPDQKLRGRIVWSHDSQFDLRVAAIVHCLPIGL